MGICPLENNYNVILFIYYNMSKPSGICKPPATPRKPLGNTMPVFGPIGPTEIDVRRRLAECRPPKNPDENKAVWVPVRTIFDAFADAEIARARLADTPPDSPDITAERAAAYTDAKTRLDQVRIESGMYGDDAENRQINMTITDLEYIYKNPIPPSQPTPKPSQSKPKPTPHPGFGGRRTRRRKGTMRHQRKKRSSRYKTYRKSAA